MINLEKIKERIPKKNLIEIALALLLAGLFFQFQFELFLMAMLFFSLSIVALFIAAGFVVSRSLIEVAAGLSLMIFILHTYCSVVPVTDRIPNQELESVIYIAIILLIGQFLYYFYKDLEEILNDLKQNETWLTIVLGGGLFFTFMSVFIYYFARIIYLIINNLCLF